MIAVETI